MEAACIAMQGNYNVPTWIVDRIENPHLQRFVAALRFHKRIVAKERRCFHCFRLFESLQKKAFPLDQCFYANRFANAASDILGLFCG